MGMNNINEQNNNNKAPTKVVKILQRPKQSQVPVVNVQSKVNNNDNVQSVQEKNDSNMTKQISTGSSIHDEDSNYNKQKSRFPTMEEDKSNPMMSPTVKDYISNHSDNGKINMINIIGVRITTIIIETIHIMIKIKIIIIINQ